MDIIIDQLEEEAYKSKTIEEATKELVRAMILEKIDELTDAEGLCNYTKVAKDLDIARGTLLSRRKDYGLI